MPRKTDIKQLQDGSIDFAHYRQRASAARSDAFWRLLRRNPAAHQVRH